MGVDIEEPLKPVRGSVNGDGMDKPLLVTGVPIRPRTAGCCPTRFALDGSVWVKFFYWTFLDPVATWIGFALAWAIVFCTLCLIPACGAGIFLAPLALRAVHRIAGWQAWALFSAGSRYGGIECCPAPEPRHLGGGWFSPLRRGDLWLSLLYVTLVRPVVHYVLYFVYHNAAFGALCLLAAPTPLVAVLVADAATPSGGMWGVAAGCVVAGAVVVLAMLFVASGLHAVALALCRGCAPAAHAGAESNSDAARGLASPIGAAPRSHCGCAPLARVGAVCIALFSCVGAAAMAMCVATMVFGGVACLRAAPSSHVVHVPAPPVVQGTQWFGALRVADDADASASPWLAAAAGGAEWAREWVASNVAGADDGWGWGWWGGRVEFVSANASSPATAAAGVNATVWVAPTGRGSPELELVPLAQAGGAAGDAVVAYRVAKVASARDWFLRLAACPCVRVTATLPPPGAASRPVGLVAMGEVGMVEVAADAAQAADAVVVAVGWGGVRVEGDVAADGGNVTLATRYGSVHARGNLSAPSLVLASWAGRLRVKGAVAARAATLWTTDGGVRVGRLAADEAVVYARHGDVEVDVLDLAPRGVAARGVNVTAHHGDVEIDSVAFSLGGAFTIAAPHGDVEFGGVTPPEAASRVRFAEQEPALLTGTVESPQGATALWVEARHGDVEVDEFNLAPPQPLRK